MYTSKCCYYLTFTVASDKYRHQGCVNNFIFSNWGSCRAHFMCHHELRPTSASHPFSFPNSFCGLMEKKYQHILWTYLPKFRFSGLIVLAEVGWGHIVGQHLSIRRPYVRMCVRPSNEVSEHSKKNVRNVSC